MRAVLGPFHPYLEDALAEEISRRKNADPLAPLLVLVPSESLSRRLRILLAGERKLNLLNIHLLTFFQLSLRLHEEFYDGRRPEISDDLFLEEALRQLIRAGHPAAAGFSELEETAAGCAALWQTLRDLKDGLVDSARALEAVAEGHFDADGKEKLTALLSLYGAFLSRCRDWQIEDYTDLDVAVLGQIDSSAFLRRFDHVFYYGFYDLTQVQIDFFHAVARHYPTTLYFPLLRAAPGAGAWSFSERFYERYVQGLSQESAETLTAASSPLEGRRAVSLFADEPAAISHLLPPALRCTIMSASEARDEILTVAKEILRLVANEGMAFGEIGVVARTLAPYSHWIKEIFAEHYIPVAGSLEEPLVQFPLAKASLLLIQLHAKDYRRSAFIDLVSSPFFTLDPFCPGAIKPRPDLWDLLTRRLGITKGLEQWRRVERHQDRDLILAERGENGESQIVLSGSATQLGILWRLFTVLHRDLHALPSEGAWSEYASAWKGLFAKYLGMGAGSLSPAEPAVGEALLGALERLAALDGVGPKPSQREFAETYQRWLERTSIAVTDSNLRGVAVLDAMAARGIPFRALFIVGLNEGAFPRTIREDAFLRDRHRRLFDTVLGSKVSEKLAAFDEEKLLFTLLVGAAEERLYCLYQRADESGRALAPSWYLAELRRAVSGEETQAPLEEIHIPRGIPEKALVEPFHSVNHLPPEELGIRLSLSGEDPSPLVELFSLAAPLYHRGRRALDILEDPAGQLADHDGQIGPLAEHGAHLSRHAVSPTALERYALCPFQFFAANLLGLSRLEQPEEILFLEPAEIGRLCHSILRSVFEALIAAGSFEPKSPDTDLAAVLGPAAEKVYADYEAENPPGFPVEWEALKEHLTEMLGKVVAKDIEELRGSGFRPAALEIDLRDSYPWDDPANLKGIAIRGRLDRIDVDPEAGRCRVIDYKYRTSRDRSTSDGNLVRGAIRGQRLQPPFYVLLAKRFAKETAKLGADPAVVAAFYFLAPKWKDGPLVTSAFAEEAWEGETGTQLKRTLSFLLEGIERGQFFIRPGEHCRRCDVSEVCRKNHLPSFWRAERDRRSSVHRNLGRQSVAKEPSEARSRPRRGQSKRG
ncbi:MAG: exodeoxyribonuclease V subunit gamma [Deltaproteobacteria bacterium]|nr:exodeoxyribonuclease V subunit gamma [Deltaproteobacteria bacterium]